MLMSVPPIPAFHRVPKTTAGTDSSVLGTRVPKENPIENSHSADGGASTYRDLEVPSGSFSQVFSSTVANAGLQFSSKGNSNLAKSDSLSVPTAEQPKKQPGSTRLQSLAYLLVSKNGSKPVLELSSELSRVRENSDSSTTPGPDRPEASSAQSPVTSTGSSTSLPFIPVSVLPVFVTIAIASGGSISESHGAVGIAAKNTAFDDAGPFKADTATEGIGDAAIVSAGLKTGSAGAPFDRSKIGVETLAFNLQLSPAESGPAGRPANNESALDKPASGPMSSPEAAPSNTQLLKLAPDAAADLAESSSLSVNSLAAEIASPQDGGKPASSEFNDSGSQSPLEARNAEPIPVPTEPKSQTGVSSGTVPPLKQIQPVLSLQDSSYSAVSGASNPESALRVSSPEKENTGRAATTGPQPLVASGLAVAATDKSVLASPAKLSSNSPIMPMENHAVPVQASPKTDLSVSMVGQSGETVNVRVSEKAGEIQIAVRASDSATAMQIRHELPAMQTGLERIGWHSETTSALLHSNAQQSDSRSDSEAGGRNQQSWRNNSDGQPRQDRRRTPGQGQWWALSGQDI